MHRSLARSWKCKSLGKALEWAGCWPSTTSRPTLVSGGRRAGWQCIIDCNDKIGAVWSRRGRGATGARERRLAGRLIIGHLFEFIGEKGLANANARPADRSRRACNMQQVAGEQVARRAGCFSARPVGRRGPVWTSPIRNRLEQFRADRQLWLAFQQVAALFVSISEQQVSAVQWML